MIVLQWQLIVSALVNLDVIFHVWFQSVFNECDKWSEILVNEYVSFDEIESKLLLLFRVIIRIGKNFHDPTLSSPRIQDEEASKM